jgi:hypothetical protein
LEQGYIFFQCTRVKLVIFGVVELRRVNEYTAHRNVIIFYRCAQQLQVPFVQGAHGWHKAYAFATATERLHCFPNNVYLRYYLHMLGFRVKTIKAGKSKSQQIKLKIRIKNTNFARPITVAY